MKDTHVVRNQVSREAGEWLIRERAGELTPEDCRALAEWLAISTVHIEEYLAASVAWALLAVDNEPKESVAELLARARREEAPSNVVPVRGNVDGPTWALGCARGGVRNAGLGRCPAGSRYLGNALPDGRRGTAYRHASRRIGSYAQYGHGCARAPWQCRP